MVSRGAGLYFSHVKREQAFFVKIPNSEKKKRKKKKEKSEKEQVVKKQKKKKKKTEKVEQR